MHDISELHDTERERLIRRLSAVLGGDRHTAEDLAQEALLRAWQRLPAGLDALQQRAWLARTARRLAIDELRRRARRPVAALDPELPALGEDDDEGVAEAMALLSPHERFLLALRFEAGFSHAEIGRLLEIGEEAARKRVSRARSAFLAARRQVHAGADPLVLVLIREDPPAPYVAWLEAAGARVRLLTGRGGERDLALADGIVFTGSFSDVDSRLYGEAPRAQDGHSDLARDRLDLALMQGALALDLPVVGVCRGGQLLNIASGGTLYQDVVEDGATTMPHRVGLHEVRTAPDAGIRRLLGARAEVQSQHHQAVRRLGRRLRITAVSPDGVVETIERGDRRFALGLQWHPELGEDGAANRSGRIVAEALVEAARERAA